MEITERLLKMKKIIYLLLLLIMVLGVNASLDWTVPTQTKERANFEIYISGDSLYGLEIELPNTFIIISDPSQGVRDDDGIYRTSYSTNLVLAVRAPNDAKTYTIKGKYTQGSGINNLPDKTIDVQNSEILELRCPTCPSETQWTECNEGKQTKLAYTCDASTNYICVSQIQRKSCISESCEAGWICIDEDKLGLRKENCDYSTTIDCSNGCDMNKNACNANTENNNLITGAVTGAGEGQGSMWLQKIWFGFVDWLKGIFSF
jgi:hypothetical protein